MILTAKQIKLRKKLWSKALECVPFPIAKGIKEYPFGPEGISLAHSVELEAQKGYRGARWSDGWSETESDFAGEINLSLKKRKEKSWIKSN